MWNLPRQKCPTNYYNNITVVYCLLTSKNQETTVGNNTRTFLSRVRIADSGSVAAIVSMDLPIHPHSLIAISGYLLKLARVIVRRSNSTLSRSFPSTLE